MSPPEKLNIAWVTSGFYADENDFGGAAAIHLLARELSQAPEIELTVFALYYPSDKNDYILYNAKVYTFSNCPQDRLTSLKKIKVWRDFRKKFAKENFNKKFDVIHSFWSGEPGYNATKVSQKFNIPHAANICGGELASFPEINYGSQLKSVQRFFVGKTFEKATTIVCGSDFVIKTTSEIYDNNIAGKIIKIPFGVDETLFCETENTAEVNTKEPVLINIAHAAPVKGHDNLLLALTKVKLVYPNIMLKVYGNDPNETIIKQATKMGLSSNVQVSAFTDYKNIPAILKEADIFVLSSIYESQNMSILEAAFSGLPVVSTDVGVAFEITPYISKPGDAAALAQNIINALKQRKPAYKDLHERFSLKASAEKYIKLYKELAEKNN
ncbi:MAG TPA: glycosyltransferase family 4 protein [Ignavibacteria bacterium]|nr:glycosyltransferase family 4 protein [Ignavibacteria bacterium]HMQ98971.1 glycosyltransferase family 4 protein [Ignavibacteria bacterium]